jgi:hypothetical protein
MDQQSSSMVGDYAPFDLPEPDGRVRPASFILDRKCGSLREAEYHDGAKSISIPDAVI